MIENIDKGDEISQNFFHPRPREGGKRENQQKRTSKAVSSIRIN